ncbi:MAG: hypothetical protein Q9196_006640 [Gyalolechia fulgens]
MPARHNTRARDRSAQLSGTFPIVKFLNNWIEAQRPKSTNSRLNTVEIWVADQKKKITAAASAANKRKKIAGKNPSGRDGGRDCGGDGGGEGDDGREKSGEDINGRAHGSQDSREGTGNRHGRNGLLGEQAEGKQPGEWHVQNNRQGDRQGDGLAEQSQDGRLGEGSILQRVQDFVQSGMQSGIPNPSDGQGDNRYNDVQDYGQAAISINKLQHEPQGPQQESLVYRDAIEHNLQQQDQVPENGTSQNKPGEYHQPVDNVSEEESIPLNTESEGNPPHNSPPHGNSPGLNYQDIIPPSDMSPRNNTEGNVTQDTIAYNSNHGSTIQERRRRMQATAEEYDCSPTPDTADYSSPSHAAVSYAGRALGTQAMVRDRMSPEPASSSIRFQTPGTVQTPVVSVSRPTSSLSLPHRDGIGMDSLLTAAQLPDILRLTARLVDKESLFNTLSLLYALPGNGQLSPARRGDIVSFVGSLFDKASYWTLHDNIIAYIERTGFRSAESGNGSNINSRGRIARFESSRTPSVDSQFDSILAAPPLLTMFAKQWRGFVQFSYQTSTAAAVKLTRMKHEEQCYLHWCTLRAIWKASDPGRNDNNKLDDSEGEGDERTTNGTTHLEYTDPAVAENESTALLQFLTDQMEQRKSELKLRRSPQYEAHTVRLLKSLVAPFLGLTATPTLWRKTMTMGRAVHTVVRLLGSGALAVVKRERSVTFTSILCDFPCRPLTLSSIRCLGPEMLERILPTIRAKHPELRQILQTVGRGYVQPLLGPDPRLRLEDVGSFIRIDSMARMCVLCSINANGLNGILGAQADGNEPPSAGQHDTTPPLGVLSNEPQADPLADLDNDGEAIYNVQELLGQGLHRPNPLPAALPTPPLTAERSGGKRKIGPEREVSPTKRLARYR